MTLQQAQHFYPDAIEISGRFSPGILGRLDIQRIQKAIYQSHESKVIFHSDSGDSFKYFFSHEAALIDIRGEEAKNVN